MRSTLEPTIANDFLSFYELNSSSHFSVQKNLNWFFTEDMLMKFLFYSNRLNTTQNFLIVLILVIQTCLFPLNKKKKLKSGHFLM